LTILRHNRATGLLSIVAFAIATCGSGLGELEVRVSNLWRGNDSQRIEFVRWIDREQSFARLTHFQVRELLGKPTSVHDNQEYPFNGLDEKFTEESLAAMGGSVEKPVMWIYQTLRNGSPESIEWGGEGSGYLLDLVIHFGADGIVYGCGTNQFTTGGDYYDLLESKSP
jgi:hypothetical protein